MADLEETQVQVVPTLLPICVTLCSLVVGMRAMTHTDVKRRTMPAVAR